MKKTVLWAATALLLAVHVCAQNEDRPVAGGKEQQRFFIVNSGQWPAEVLFLARTGGMDAWITRKGIVYDLYQLSPAAPGEATEAALHNGYSDGNVHKEGQVIRINYLGSSADSGCGTKVLPGYYNYLQGNDPSHWSTGVRRYEEVSVPGIYPGIDVHYYFEAGALRYDFIVHPGASIHAIRMEVEGASGNPSTAERALIIPTRFGDLKQDRLFTYQSIDGRQHSVRNSFVTKNNIVSFLVGDFDHNHDLVIDPIVWSTFIGGAGNEQMQGIAIDASGNICLAGASNAGTYPVTSGAYDLTYNGAANDVIASKLNPAGTTLLFSTFIGGTGQDNANGLKVDASGNFYITGTTTSIDYPTTSGVLSQVYPGGGSDGFITKLNSSGTALVYSTYIGSTGQDVCNAIAIDGSGNAFITGSTTSTAFPVTAGAYDQVHNAGGTDVFISELNATGSALVYSTFMGGASGEVGNAIEVDASGNAYVTGYTASSNFPTTAGAYSQTYMGGASEGFIAKFNAAGSALVYSTHIGGSSDDRPMGIAVDALGNAYITGYTYNTTTLYPTTAGAYDQSYNGGTCDIMVTKLNATGSALVYSTFIGGSGNDFATGISVDANGNAVITGYVASSNYPTTAGSQDQSYNGGTYDVGVTRLNSAGSALMYSTFLGGASDEYGTAIVADATGGVYVTGSTGSTAFPVTAGVYDQSFNSGTDVFVTKLLTCTPPVATAGSNTPLCNGQTINLTSSGGGAYSWSGPNGFSSTLQNPSIAGATAGNSGTYSVTVTNASGCAATATISVVVGPVISSSSNGPVCAGQTLNLSSSGGVSYSWTGPNAFTSTQQNPSIAGITAAGSGTYSVTITDASSCVGTATVNVTVNPVPVPTASAGGPVCAGQTLNLTASGGGTYAWSGPNSFSSTQQNPAITGATTSNAGTYTVTVTNASGCSATATVTAVVNALPAATASSNGPVCAGQTLNLTSSGGGTYAWGGPNSFSSTQQNPAITGTTISNAGTYTVTVTNASGCSATATVTAVVNTLPTASASSGGQVCAGQTLNLTSSGGASYAWSGPNSFSSTQQNPAITGATISNAGTYTVTVTNASGCSATATVTAVVNALPAATASSGGPVCAGQTLNLTSSGGGTYAWSGPNSFSSTQQNPAITGATISNAGTYTVTVTNASGCSATATVTAIVNALPTATASSGGPVCAGQTLNLTSSGGASYAWSGPNSFTSTLQNPAIPNAQAIHAGTYSVTVTSAAGCTSTATVNVIVNTAPTATGSSNSPICSGQNLDLISSGGSTYSWSGPGSFSSVQQNPVIAGATPSNSGTYTVTVSSVNGCTASSTINVVVNALPNATASSNSPVCEGQSLNLSSAGGTAYAWSGPASYSSMQQAGSISTTTVANAGTYSVTVTDANACSATATVNVTVNTLPVAQAASNSPACENSAVLLSANGGASYAWSGPNGFTDVQQNPSVAARLAAAGTYSVSVTDVNGCTSSASVTVVVLPAPAGTAADNGQLCEGTTLQLTASGGQSYSWTGPAGFNSTQQNPTLTNISASEAGTYSVIVSDANSCTDTVTVTVAVNTVDTSVTQSGSTLTASVSGAVYQWIDCSTQQLINGATSQAYTAPQTGQYAVIITENGCTDTSSCHMVLSVGFPGGNNGSGINVFPNPGSGLFHIELSAPAAIRVYDLTGRIVFSDAKAEGPVYTLQLEQATGMYILEIATGEYLRQVRLTIKD